jgi:hypothetical protein
VIDEENFKKVMAKEKESYKHETHKIEAIKKEITLLDQ